REPDQGSESGRQIVRAQDLPGRSRRTPVQSPGYEVCEGIAGGSVSVPGEIFEAARPREVAGYDWICVAPHASRLLCNEPLTCSQTRQRDTVTARRERESARPGGLWQPLPI